MTSIAPLVTAAAELLVAHGPLGELYSEEEI
jgi:hypothetical protein